MPSIEFLFILSIANIVASQVLFHPQSSISVAEHETVHLQCRFFLPIDGCYWLKDDGLIEIDDRYEYIGNENDGDCSIVIKDIRAEDSGQWTCGSPQTSSGNRKRKSNPAIITVITPPRLTFNMKGVQLEEGEKIYLSNIDQLYELACVIKTQLKASQVDVKWLAHSFNGTLLQQPSIAVNTVTYSTINNYITSTINRNTMYYTNLRKITCLAKINNSNITYQSYVRIVKL